MGQGKKYFKKEKKLVEVKEQSEEKSENDFERDSLDYDVEEGEDEFEMKNQKLINNYKEEERKSQKRRIVKEIPSSKQQISSVKQKIILGQAPKKQNKSK